MGGVQLIREAGSARDSGSRVARRNLCLDFHDGIGLRLPGMTIVGLDGSEPCPLRVILAKPQTLSSSDLVRGPSYQRDWRSMGCPFSAASALSFDLRMCGTMGPRVKPEDDIVCGVGSR